MQAEAIEVFITQKESHVLSEDVGSDLTSCESLISRHNNYITSLNSFKDNITGLTELKDRLIASQHGQTKALKQRHQVNSYIFTFVLFGYNLTTFELYTSIPICYREGCPVL